MPDTRAGVLICDALRQFVQQRFGLLDKHGQDIRYTSAEITGSYPVCTSSKRHNCCAETGKRA